MKTLKTIHAIGSQQSKATSYMLWPGYILLEFTDGSTHYLQVCGFDEALRQAKALGHDCATFEAAYNSPKWYPPKPENAKLYYHNFGYEEPTALGEWQWSDTFGRWSRLVTFADGWNGFTYPKI